MHAMQGERLLTLWETCRTQREPVRALAMLQAAAPGAGMSQLAELPLAERNARLLALRGATFGRQLQGVAVCEVCGASLEFDVDADALREALAVPQAHGDGARPVNSADLLACMDTADGDAARRMLLRRTLGSTLPDGPLQQIATDELARFEAINASAEIRLELECSQCGNRPVMDLDIARFLWQEVRVAATRLLADVHTLASAYGWSEASILALSNARRAVYLELVSA